jgi:hypothetical protein
LLLVLVLAVGVVGIGCPTLASDLAIDAATAATSPGFMSVCARHAVTTSTTDLAGMEGSTVLNSDGSSDDARCAVAVAGFSTVATVSDGNVSLSVSEATTSHAGGCDEEAGRSWGELRL